MDCPFLIQWGLVTVEEAKRRLAEFNTRNRPIKQASVEAYAQDMAGNRWSPNHQPIAFGEDGDLIDGQNRLAAIVLSGKPQWMLIVANVPKRIEGTDVNVMDTIDRGTPRSLADMLRLGHGMGAEANAVAAACLQIARLCVLHPELQTRKATLPQTTAILDIFRPEIKWMVSVRATKHGLRSAALCGTIAFARAVLPEAAQSFYEALSGGADGHRSPVRLLRTALDRGTFDLGGHASDRKYFGLIVLELVRAFSEGREIEALPASCECTALAWFRDRNEARCLKVAALFPPMPKTSKPGKVQQLPPWETPKSAPAGTAQPVERTGDPERTAGVVRPVASARRLLA